MAEHVIPHFHNDPGVPTIRIGVKEFMCTGATPPFDHPISSSTWAATAKGFAPIARRDSSMTRRSAHIPSRPNASGAALPDS